MKAIRKGAISKGFYAVERGVSAALGLRRGTAAVVVSDDDERCLNFWLGFPFRVMPARGRASTQPLYNFFFFKPQPVRR